MEKINSEVFLKVVEAGNFKGAADALGYTQAGISYIINAMETEFGLKLFNREYGGVTLTSEGEQLLPDIRQLFVSEHRIKEKIKDLKGLETGNVRVSVFTSAYIHWIPGILTTFHEKHPNVSVDVIQCEEEHRNAEMIYNNEVDCGFYMGYIRDDVDVLEFREVPVVAVVSPDHPMAKADCFPISKMEEYPYIELTYDRKSRLIQGIFRDNNISPKVSYMTENDYAAIAMASQGLGYCLFSEMLLKDIGFDIARVPLEPPVTIPVGIAVRSLESCTQATAAFVSCAVEWIHNNGI